MVTNGVVQTSCSLCTGRCGLNVHVREGKIVNVEGMPEHPISRGYICPKAKTLPEQVYLPDRITHPMKRENGSWKRISWDEALDTIASKLKENKIKYGPEALLVFIGLPVFLDSVPGWMMLRRFLDVYGSPNYFSVDSMCYRPRLVAYYLTMGGLMRPEVQNSKLMVIVGSDMDNSYPPMGNLVRENKKKGSKLIVIDPRRTALAKEADMYLQIRPGTDPALWLGMMNVIISEGLCDREFVEKYTVGFDMLVEHVKAYPPEKVAEITWVPVEQIRTTAQLFASIKPASIYQGFNSLDETTSGFQSGRGIPILHAITGNMDMPGGLVPRMMLKAVANIRLEHMIKTRALWEDKYPLMYKLWGRAMGEGQMMDLPDLLLSDKNPIKAMVVECTNPLLTWPDSTKVAKALKSVEFLVYMGQYMTSTAELAHIMLPTQGPLEKSDFCIDNRITPYIMMKKKIVEIGECWHDAKFWLSLAKRMGYDEYFPWKDPDEFIDYWLEPSEVNFKMLTEEKPGGMPLEMKYGTFRKNGFPTPSGKVEIFSETMAQLGYDPLPTYKEPYESPVSRPDLAKEYPLILTTGQRRLEFLHSQMRNVPTLRAMRPEPLADIHPETAKKYGISDGDMITISTRRGSIDIKANLTEDNLPQLVSVPHGWQEANVNVLTFARPADPVTGVPNMKALLCKIEKKKESDTK